MIYHFSAKKNKFNRRVFCCMWRKVGNHILAVPLLPVLRRGVYKIIKLCLRKKIIDANFLGSFLKQRLK